MAAVATGFLGATAAREFLPVTGDRAARCRADQEREPADLGSRIEALTHAADVPWRLARATGDGSPAVRVYVGAPAPAAGSLIHTGRALPQWPSTSCARTYTRFGVRWYGFGFGAVNVPRSCSSGLSSALGRHQRRARSRRGQRRRRPLCRADRVGVGDVRGDRAVGAERELRNARAEHALIGRVGDLARVLEHRLVAALDVGELRLERVEVVARLDPGGEPVGHHVVPVGVGERHDVQLARVEQRGGLRIGAVAREQLLGPAQQQLRVGDLARMHAAHVHRDRLLARVRLAVGDAQHPDVVPARLARRLARRIADVDQLHELRVPRLDRAHLRDQLIRRAQVRGDVVGHRQPRRVLALLARQLVEFARGGRARHDRHDGGGCDRRRRRRTGGARRWRVSGPEQHGAKASRAGEASAVGRRRPCPPLPTALAAGQATASSERSDWLSSTIMGSS